MNKNINVDALFNCPKCGTEISAINTDETEFDYETGHYYVQNNCSCGHSYMCYLEFEWKPTSFRISE